jgi:PAS domain S-box-containing protein
MSTGTKPGWAKGLRKEQRIPGCKPVTVMGRDAYGHPFLQNTFTVEIGARGARLQGLPPLAPDTILFLESNGEQARYRAVWVGEKGTNYEGHVGLECIDLDKSIFGIEPPPHGHFYDEYKRVEAELQRTQDRYKDLFENSLGLICTHDLQGTLLSINPAAAEALGYDPRTGPGRNLSEFLAPSVRGSFVDYLRRIYTQGQDSGYMLVVGRNQMKRVWQYRNIVVHEGNAPPYVLGHAMDVTEQKKAQRELQNALRTLQITLAEVRTLRGLLPICAWCKRIRGEDGNWHTLESYVTQHSDASFSHGICPRCEPGLRSGKRGTT